MYLSNQYKDANDYFEQAIFKNNYFQVPDNEVFHDPFARRKLENLENAFRIIEIENGMYITETCLTHAGVNKDFFQSYKNEVEQFVNSNEFFTLADFEGSWIFP